VRDDVSLNHVPLLVVIHNNLVEFAMLGEKKVAVPEANASSWFCRKHVEPVPTTGNRESSASIITSALEVAQLVHFSLALWIFGQDALIVCDFGNSSLLVDNLLGFGCSRTSFTTTPASPSTSSSASRGVGFVGGNRNHVVPIWRSVLRRTTKPLATDHELRGGRRLLDGFVVLFSRVGCIIFISRLFLWLVILVLLIIRVGHLLSLGAQGTGSGIGHRFIFEVCERLWRAL
jgi:hypothetical protein